MLLDRRPRQLGRLGCTWGTKKEVRVSWERRVSEETCGPILLARVKVGLDLVNYSTFALVEFGASAPPASDMDDEPLLVLPRNDRVEPLPDVGANRGAIRLVVL